jgi:hypothetical protein
LMGELQLASVEIYGEIAFGRSAFKGLFWPLSQWK